MKDITNKLTSAVVKLHESTKAGKKVNGYKMFKEAMSLLLQLESNGCKSPTTETAKKILSEYYNTYKTQTAKDSTRVVVESKAEDEIRKEENKRQAEIKAELKTLLKEIVSNATGMKGGISGANYELINFHADQIAKIAGKIKIITRDEMEDYLE